MERKETEERHVAFSRKIAKKEKNDITSKLEKKKEYFDRNIS